MNFHMDGAREGGGGGGKKREKGERQGERHDDVSPRFEKIEEVRLIYWPDVYMV